MLMQSLLKLSTVKDDSGIILLTQAAQSTLVTAAQSAPKFFIATVGNEALRSNISGEERSMYIMKLLYIVNNYPESQLVVLPRIVETLTRCLDPAEPGIRKALFKSCATVLHALTLCYPMVSFHQPSQLFAVGTDKISKSLIVIYDLRTATKWKILDGHTGDVTAIAFSEDGGMLASYSGDETPPSMRVWRTGSSLFPILLGLQGKCLRTYHLKVIEAESMSKKHLLKNTKIVWKNPSTIQLTREDKSEVQFTV